MKKSLEPMPPFIEKWVKENKQFLFRQPKIPSRLTWWAIGFIMALGLALWFFIVNNRYLYNNNHVIQKEHTAWWCSHGMYLE